jgi:group I intron endonuclease
MVTTYNLILCSQILADYDQLLCSQLLTNYELPSLLSILPVGVKFYDDLLSNKKLIAKENRGKSGVYLFYNKLNSNSYIGSGVDLTDRLGDYFSNTYLNKSSTQTSLIVKAIKKYSLDNFSLTILEYVPERKLAVIKEQIWIDKVNPEYNTLKLAGSSLGYKHTEESRFKIALANTGKTNLGPLGHEHTEEFKLNRKLNTLGELNPNYGKGTPLYQYDYNTGELINKFSSIRKATVDLHMGYSTLCNYIEKKLIYKNNFIFSTSELHHIDDRLNYTFNVDIRKPKLGRSIYLFNINNKDKPLNTFISASECARQLNINDVQVGRLCKSGKIFNEFYYLTYINSK